MIQNDRDVAVWFPAEVNQDVDRKNVFKVTNSFCFHLNFCVFISFIGSFVQNKSINDGDLIQISLI